MNIFIDFGWSCVIYLKDRVSSLQAVTEIQEILAVNSTEG